MKGMLERLRQKRVTLTPQRMAIAEYLSNSEDHPSAEEIHRVIKRRYPTVSLATVYSTLELLKECGEIQELSIRKRGKACFDPNPDIHHHLLCRKCGRILGIEFDHPRNCPILGTDNIDGCKIEEVQAYLYGICSECVERESGKRETRKAKDSKEEQPRKEINR
jgi:Fur family peroxide stress response transcriptional regulator